MFLLPAGTTLYYLYPTRLLAHRMLAAFRSLTGMKTFHLFGRMRLLSQAPTVRSVQRVSWVPPWVGRRLKAERFAASHKGCGHPNPFDYTFKQKVMEISSFIVLTGECTTANE